MIAPTFRSRLGQPSRRLPIPGAKELSTVEWQAAQVIPIDFSTPSALKFPFTPTTAFNCKSAMVVAGSSRFIAPDCIPLTTDAGNALASTFNPTANAVLGLTPLPKPPLFAPAIALSMWSTPLQNSSSPNVSNRNISFPFLTKAGSPSASWGSLSPLIHWVKATAATNDITTSIFFLYIIAILLRLKNCSMAPEALAPC